MMPVLYWTNTIKILDIYSACSLKIQCNGRHVAPLGHIIPSSTSLYSYSLMLHVLGRSRKYQSFNWPDLEPTSTILGAWTHIYHTWGLNPHLLYLKLEPTSTIFEAWTHIYYTWGKHANYYTTDAVLRNWLYTVYIDVIIYRNEPG